jgi:8-oxo-dGTP pyrophosphatase MutT (NUDIX family)
MDAIGCTLADMGGLPMNRDLLLALLASHTPFDSVEAAFVKQTLDFVRSDEDFASRLNPTGHLTGSAWVVNEDTSQVLLIHHAGLDRWLQPGGHVEDGDLFIADTALREAREECGITGPVRMESVLYDLDVHPIPAKKAFPAHLHYDFRFLVRIAGGSALSAQPGEIHAVKWFTTGELDQAQLGPSISRMLAKLPPPPV